MYLTLMATVKGMEEGVLTTRPGIDQEMSSAKAESIHEETCP